MCSGCRQVLLKVLRPTPDLRRRLLTTSARSFVPRTAVPGTHATGGELQASLRERFRGPSNRPNGVRDCLGDRSERSLCYFGFAHFQAVGAAIGNRVDHDRLASDAPVRISDLDDMSGLLVESRDHRTLCAPTMVCLTAGSVQVSPCLRGLVARNSVDKIGDGDVVIAIDDAT
jgi:hypothetical protein